MPPSVLLAVVGFLVVFVGLIVLFRVQENKRTEALKQVSASLGLTFEAKGDPARIRAFCELPMFSLGRARQAWNVMSGRSGTQELKILDYQYTVGSGKSALSMQQTVAIYPGAGRGLPDFMLAPESPLTKLGEKLGYKDIDFDSSPIFSEKYLLRGNDEAAVRAAFSEEMRRALERLEGWTVEVQAGNVGVYRLNRRPTPEQMAGFLEQSREVLHALTRR